LAQARRLPSFARRNRTGLTLDPAPKQPREINGGLLLTQVRRDPRQLRIAHNAARNNLRLAAA